MTRSCDDSTIDSSEMPAEGNIALLLHSRSIGHGHPEDIPITKARSDKRNYRRIVLPNAMQVLLVSDPETDTAAASMDVHVGYFCDPVELPGLAHFLEHMLFFSNEKYPEEGSFKKFLGSRGGSSNAYTASLSTNFQFDVGADHLEEALDRFSQFFICPSFSEDATGREVKAVDSENSRNLLSDPHRLAQIEDHLTSADHPLHKFSCGNLQTLEEIPRSKGIDTRAEMLKFYQDHYSSNLMCIAIYGKEDLDQLEAMAKEKFCEVRNLEHEVVHFRGQPCTSEHLQILVKAVPITEGHDLKLSWPVLPSLIHYKEAPLNYVAHLLGHEGEGSVLALLKQLSWADGLAAGEDSSLHFSFFNVVIELTDAGEEHIEEIVGFIFQYLNILQGKDGIQSWIFDELQELADMGFNFQDKYSPFSYTSAIAANMRVFPPRDWLCGALPRVFDERIISKAMEVLTPENIRILTYSKRYAGATTEIEPWYGTQYSCKKIDNAVMTKWKSPEIDTRLHLPSRNEFIPTDFTNLCDGNGVNVQTPCILKNSSMVRLWYKPDIKFQTPKAKLSLLISCPASKISPEAALLAAIFTDLVNDSLSTYTYDAWVAGLGYGFSTHGGGFRLSVSGYNHKLIDLANKIVEVLVNLEVKEDRFRVTKENYLKAFMNYQFEKPLDQATYNSGILSLYSTFHYTDFLEVLPTLTTESLKCFIPQLFGRVFLECFVAGNITSKQAQDFLQQVEDSLLTGPMKSKPPFSSQLMDQRALRLEDGANFTYPTIGRNPDDENSGLYLCLQLGPDETRLNVLNELLAYVMNEEFFHQLRTIEQLGYVVSLSPGCLSGIRSLNFEIQSTVKDPEGLEARVEAFIDQYHQTLENMTQEEFEANLQSYIKLKLEKHKNIWEEIGEFWSEIKDGTLKFNRREVEAVTAQNVQKGSLVDFYNTYVSADGPRRRKLSCQVYGSKHLGEYKAFTGEGAVDTASTRSLNMQSAVIEETTENGELQVGDKESIPAVGSGKKLQHGDEYESNGEDLKKSFKEEDSGEAADGDECQGEVKFERRTKLIEDMYTFKRSQSFYGSIRGGIEHHDMIKQYMYHVRLE
ncbi:hypothetical protein R1sor_005713 [Riccia sorocarpa]|uniref:Insulin-degrading enzyme n=1 Tax=Riccia sorocarpa TaxID=122646 RepID=A0ABD3HNB0_9MARC